jgi:wyosine [tRNA(Phe)-imidazoG37] synthetase (radical SAM superfamily)
MLDLLDTIVYGPVSSRRLGRSLGINVLPAGVKVCNFNCAYCQYGWSRPGAIGGCDLGGRWPSPRAIADAVGRRLARAVMDGERLDRATIAGHGEPTLHPEFSRVVTELRKVRDRIAPGVRLCVLSNASTLLLPDTHHALRELDERHMKLDAGDARLVLGLNGSGVAPDATAAALRELGGVTVQAMFVRDPTGRLDNSGSAPVGAWLDRVRQVRPIEVHVYTIEREPAWRTLQPVAARRLREIARAVQAAGTPAFAFPARIASRTSAPNGLAE